MNGISIIAIQRETARVFGVGINEMKSDRRAAAIARPRQVAMYIARQITPQSLPAIGLLFGGRDHTTVIHAVKRIDDLMTRDLSLRAQVKRVRNNLSTEFAEDDLSQIENLLSDKTAETAQLRRENEWLRWRLGRKAAEAEHFKRLAWADDIPPPRAALAKERLCMKCHTEKIISPYPGLCKSCRRFNKRYAADAEGFAA